MATGTTTAKTLATNIAAVVDMVVATAAYVATAAVAAVAVSAAADTSAAMAMAETPDLP